MRSSFLVVPILLGALGGCTQEVTSPGGGSRQDPDLSQGNGPPAQSGVVTRFTNVDYGVTFTWNYDPETQLLIHNSIHDGLEGFPADNFDIVECIAPTESGEWVFQQVATPSGDIHDRDGSREFHARVYDATGAPLHPLFGIPWPSCDLMSPDRLLAEGTSHVWWVDNDFYGIGGPGANSFGRVVIGRLEGPEGELIHLREVSRFLFTNDGEFRVVVESITISPDPRE